jgi:hypothetical protein
MKEKLDYRSANKGLDLVVRIYLKRCASYMVNGVPPGWTGIKTLSEK